MSMAIIFRQDEICPRLLLRRRRLCFYQILCRICSCSRSLWVDSTTFPMDLPMPFCCRWYFGEYGSCIDKKLHRLAIAAGLADKNSRTMKQQSFLSGQLKR